MSDPYVPSGREYDEGLGPTRKRRRLSRVIPRIRQTGKSGRRKAWLFQLVLDPKVGQREQQRKREHASAQGPDPSHVPSTASGPEALDAVQATPTRTTEQSTTRSTEPIEQVLERAIGGAPLLVGWIAANQPDDLTNTAVSYVKSVLDRGLLHPPALELTRWRLELGNSTPTSGEGVQGLSKHGAIPADIREVLAYVSARRIGIRGYVEALETMLERDDAMRALRRETRSYASLEPIVKALEDEDPDLAHRRIGDLPGGYDSPACYAAGHEITLAIRATRAAMRLGKVPTCRLPAEWLNGIAHARAAAGLIRPLFPPRDQSRIIQTLRNDVSAALVALDEATRRNAHAWLANMGAHLDPPDSTRGRRSLNFSSARRRSTDEPTSAAKEPEERSFRGTRCRRCGVGEPGLVVYASAVQKCETDDPLRRSGL